MNHSGTQLAPQRRHTSARLMGMILLVGSFVVLAPAQAEAEGFVSIRCRFSHQVSDDPIVSPGAPGVTHLHQFFGSTRTDANSTHRSMAEAPSSCRLAKDTAGYWAPALVSPDGQAVRAISQIAYYRALGDDPVRAFPSDLRMIAGFPMIWTGTEGFLGWGCGNGQWYAQPQDCTGQGQLKANITFPSCWDGFRLDSADHRSHMAYRVGKRCPDSHPVNLPTLRTHITYDLVDGSGYGLSSDPMMGTENGRSLHADFWNTWHQETLEGLVRGCLLTGRNCASTTDANLSERLG
ncbi:MAG: DUF1996 domain-containing protein [Actinomycetota bacterium]|nr:DUF1996 domain-containing protein [Actinomycetota bacterium]